MLVGFTSDGEVAPPQSDCTGWWSGGAPTVYPYRPTDMSVHDTEVTKWVYNKQYRAPVLSMLSFQILSHLSSVILFLFCSTAPGTRVRHQGDHPRPFNHGIWR